MHHSNKVALNIRSCRETLGYSQDYMADALKISQSTYANIESGKTTLSLDRLIRISEIFETDIHDLIDAGFAKHNSILFSETKQVYDLLIMELKSEIDFLRSLVIDKQTCLNSPPVSHT